MKQGVVPRIEDCPPTCWIKKKKLYVATYIKKRGRPKAELEETGKDRSSKEKSNPLMMLWVKEPCPLTGELGRELISG